MWLVGTRRAHGRPDDVPRRFPDHDFPCLPETRRQRSKRILVHHERRAVLRAAAFRDPSLGVAAITTPSRGRPVEEDLVALVVTTSKAGVAQHARVVFLTCSTIPSYIARGEHMSTGPLVRFC